MDAHALGQYLREAREAKELTLDQAETTLKIRRRILEGFEQGSFNVIDASPVQIRGFIRNYARFLSLDEDLVLQFYDSAITPAARRRSRRPTAEPHTHPSPAEASRPETQSRRPSRTKRRNPLRLVTIIVLTLAALSVIAFVALELVEQPSAPAENTQVASANILSDGLPTLTGTPRPTLELLRSPTLIPRVPQNYSGQEILVTIEMRQRAWVRIVVDGVENFAGLVTPGTILEAPGVNQIIVSASNASALLVTYNGQQQPSFGARGQSVEINFGRNNNITISSGPDVLPTSEFSPTPTRTVESLAATLIAGQTASATFAPTPLPLPTVESAVESAQVTPQGGTPTVQATATGTASPTATAAASLTNTPLALVTATLPAPTPSAPAAVEPTSAATATPGITAIVPPRITATNPTPVK